MYPRKPLRPNWRSSLKNAKPARKSFSAGLADLGAEKTTVDGLLADITHEVRTPMNGMFGMLDFLLASDLTQDQREAAITAQAAAEDLLSLFNNIIDLPMAEADALSLRQSCFELDSTIKSLLDSLAVRARIKGADIEVRHPYTERPFAVVGDVDRLRQVFCNLMTYMTRRLRQEKIVVEAAYRPVEGDRVVLQVCMRAGSTSTDAFPGDENPSGSPRRFDAGELGLVVCRRLIAMMGGKMEITPLQGKGIELRALLIFAPAPAMQVAARILFVDGDAARRGAMATLFTSRRMHADFVAEPAEALDALARARSAGDAYRIVILASQLRGIAGEELGKAIKMDPAYSDVALVLLGSGDPARLKKAGFAAMVGDASDTQSLMTTMEKLDLSPAPEKIGPFAGDVENHPKNGKPLRFAGKRILVVDDDAVNRRVALQALEELECEVDAACDGKQALSMHAANAYDLILMDCEMPVMDGFEATAKIRATEAAGSRTAVIAWTARFMADGAGTLLAAGFDDLMPKPMRRETLREMLSAWLPAHAMPEEIPGSDEDDGIAEIREIFGNGFAELAALFRSDSRKRIDALQSAASNEDATQIAKIVHAFSGSAASIGAIGLSVLCKELEMQARVGVLHDVEERLSAIEKEFERVAGKLHAMVATDVA